MIEGINELTCHFVTKTNTITTVSIINFQIWPNYMFTPKAFFINLVQVLKRIPFIKIIKLFENGIFLLDHMNLFNFSTHILSIYEI